MTGITLRRNWLLPLLLLTACNPIKTIDSAGEYMPVIGDRCEHWQCFTESGRAQSDAIKEESKKLEALKSGQVPPQAPDQPQALAQYPPQVQNPAQAQATQPQTPPLAQKPIRDPNGPAWGSDPYDTYKPF